MHSEVSPDLVSLKQRHRLPDFPKLCLRLHIGAKHAVRPQDGGRRILHENVVFDVFSLPSMKMLGVGSPRSSASLAGGKGSGGIAPSADDLPGCICTTRDKSLRAFRRLWLMTPNRGGFAAILDRQEVAKGIFSLYKRGYKITYSFGPPW